MGVTSWVCSREALGAPGRSGGLSGGEGRGKRGREGKGKGRGGEEESGARAPVGRGPWAEVLGTVALAWHPREPAFLRDHSSPGRLVALATPSPESPLEGEDLLYFREPPGIPTCVGSQSGVSTHQHHLGADMQILGPLQDL